MFPGPNATVYYNEAGEVLGWDDNYYDDAPEEPDWDRIADGEVAWDDGWQDGYYGELMRSFDVDVPNGLVKVYEEAYEQGRKDKADEA